MSRYSRIGRGSNSLSIVLVVPLLNGAPWGIFIDAVRNDDLDELGIKIGVYKPHGDSIDAEVVVYDPQGDSSDDRDDLWEASTYFYVRCIHTAYRD